MGKVNIKFAEGLEILRNATMILYHVIGKPGKVK